MEKQNLIYYNISLKPLTTLLIGLILIWGTACGSLALPENEKTVAQENVPSPTASIQFKVSPTDGTQTNLPGVSTSLATIAPTNTSTPGPTPTPSKTPTPRPTITPTPIPSECKLVGQWENYTDSVAGYSLKYPAEAQLLESPSMNQTHRSVSIFLKPSCYNVSCGGQNRVIVSLLYSPEQLPIREFVEQKFHLQSNPPLNNSLQNYQETSLFVTIANVQALRIEAGITPAQPDIFIPHGQKVIHIYVMEDAMLPPYGPPCGKTLELLDEILASITLLP